VLGANGIAGVPGDQARQHLNRCTYSKHRSTRWRWARPSPGCPLTGSPVLGRLVRPMVLG
jgi:hypothetical protein